MSTCRISSRPAVENLRKQHGYEGPLFIFKGLPLERLPDVVNQTRAAGVQGSVQFFLSLLDGHDQREGFALHAAHSHARTPAHQMRR